MSALKEEVKKSPQKKDSAGYIKKVSFRDEDEDGLSWKDREI